MMFGPTGGLAYHFKFRRNQKLWLPFLLDVAGWLNSWSPKAKELVLVGPSAGYTLPPEFLKKFEYVHRVEVDPVANFLFPRRFRFVKGRVSTRDYFSLKNPDRVRDTLPFLARDFRGAAILFCNILGQLPLLVGESAAEKYMADISGVLHGDFAEVPWASYHDRYSWQGNVELEEHSDGSVVFQNSSGAILDHMTGEISGQNMKRTFWAIDKNTTHLIEFVCSKR